MSRAHGCVPTVLDILWGKCVKVDQVKEAPTKEEYRAVTIIHVNTFRGPGNPVRERDQIVHENTEGLSLT